MRVRNLTAFLTPTLLLLGLAWLATPAFAAPQPKVEICHFPPGSPDNFHTITISGKAVSAHLAHGDLSGACDAAPTCAFPATGQTTTYSADKNDGISGAVSVPDDGAVQAGAVLSYTDNGDGTITDDNTGLMWEKKSDDGSLHDKENTYPWSSSSIDTIWDWLDDVNAEGGTGFADYSDWRIPNVRELQSIVDYERIDPSMDPVWNADCANGCTVLACSCTATGNNLFYWTSTTFTGDPIRAWFVAFTEGTVNGPFSNKISSFFIRAVRGGL